MKKDKTCHWKQIEGFEDYEISDTGLIWSNKSNIYLKPHCHMDGYTTIVLYNNGKAKQFFIHRLVANAFIPKIDGKEFIDHIDGIKNNNIVSNLRWCTKSENALFDNVTLKRKKTLELNSHKQVMYLSGRMYKVMCVETGQVFESLIKASEYIGIHRACICRAIKTGGMSAGYHWKRIY